MSCVSLTASTALQGEFSLWLLAGWCSCQTRDKDGVRHVCTSSIYWVFRISDEDFRAVTYNGRYKMMLLDVTLSPCTPQGCWWPCSPHLEYQSLGLGRHHDASCMIQR